MHPSQVEQDSMNLYQTHPFLIIPVQIVVMFFAVTYTISFLGGWGKLGRTFRTDRPMPRGSFLGSGSFRYVAGYNNVLRLGSDLDRLYLKFWPRIAHPPLFLPWDQVQLKRPFRFVLRQQTLLLGQQERITFTLREGDVQRLLFLAGKAMPQFDTEGVAKLG